MPVLGGEEESRGKNQETFWILGLWTFGQKTFGL
jgi:hypothetical protein